MDNENKKKVFFIEKKKFETTADQLTVKQILVDFGGYDPSKNILVLKKDLVELKDLDQVIEMKNGMHFTVFNTEPNPVS